MYLRKVVLALLVLATVAVAQVSAVLDSPFQVRYAALLPGESWIYLINDGANGAPLSGPGIGGNVGNICVNVYAFSADEEMVSCCSCYLTPNQVVRLGVVKDILLNLTHLALPTSLTIKLLATLDGAGGTGAVSGCNNSAANVNTSGTVFVNGLIAFGTTLHLATPLHPFIPVATTETPFIPATLSSGELASLGSRCTGIIGNLSGFGICGDIGAGANGGQCRFVTII